MPNTKGFTVGDTVRLRSGGPKMTVSKVGVSMNGDIQCQWFSGSKLQDGWFAPHTLEPYPEDEKLKK